MKRMCLIGLGLGMAGSVTATIGGNVTFYRDVLPILQNHCQSCHRPGHVAPISFMTYKETRPWAEAMKYIVLAKQMPPWFAERPYVPTAAAHQSLTPGEVETIVRWADSGAPAGDPRDAPPPVYFQESRFGTPRVPGHLTPIALR